MKALRRVAISGGAAALLALGAAGPAMAHPPTVQITEPRGTLGDPATAVVATASFDSHTTLKSATATVKRVGSSAAPTTRSASPGATMRFPVSFPLNGTYEATVTVEWEVKPTFGLVGGDNGTTPSAPHQFKVAVPPVTPEGVSTSVDAGSRTVTVTWQKNPEADMRRYEVHRSHNGGDFAKVATVDHPDARFVDDTTSGAGGDYRYIVVAFRAGADSNVLASDPSAPSTAKVPDPPPPPTTAPPATAAPAAGTAAAPGAAAAPGTATTAPASGAAAITPGKVDLSGFNNVQANTPRPVTPRTVPLPDPGFQSTLPFDVPEDAGGAEPEAGDTGELAADSPGLRELGDEEDSGDRQRSLALFAGGLLATVLLMHVLWVKGEVKRVPLEVVPPEGPPPADPDGGKARRAKAPKPKPAKVGRTASPDWFVPELGVDDGADRAVASVGGERRAS